LVSGAADPRSASRYGHTEAVDDDQGGLRARRVPGGKVLGEPSHMLVPGHGTETVNTSGYGRPGAAGSRWT